MTFEQTVAYLYQRLPVFHRDGSSAFKKDLVNTQALLEALGNPERSFKSVHIAGTNGKGSTSTLMAAVLQAAGLGPVGLYTSPHLINLTERIRVAGKPVPEAWVVEFVRKHRPLIEQVEPSFFELMVAMAFQYFAEAGVTWAVVEVGLGGRLDSTNVITPVLAIITNIAWDHMDLLGDTLEKIAAEKAGIIKRGVPGVVGEVIEVTRPVFEAKAQQAHAPLHYAQERFTAQPLNWTIDGQQLLVTQLATGLQQAYTLDLLGAYQEKNLCTVLTAVEVLASQGVSLQPEVVKKALANAAYSMGLRGRMEVLGKAPLVLADIAHNPAGLQAVMAQMAKLSTGVLHMVFGVVKEKELKAVLKELPTNALYYFVKPDLPRGLDVGLLAQAAAAHGLQGETYSSVAAGLQAAIAAAAPSDTVVVTGSAFVVGEALGYVNQKIKS